MTIVLVKAVLCAIAAGVIFFGWFLATTHSPPKSKPRHGFGLDFAVYLLAGIASSIVHEALLWRQGWELSLLENAIPILNFAILFAVMNQIRRIRYSAFELEA